MTNQAILASIDEQIAKLQHARALLVGSASPVAKKPLGRPKKIASVRLSKAPLLKKRVMSEEGKARIAAAQKKRWAAAKKAAK